MDSERIFLVFTWKFSLSDEKRVCFGSISQRNRWNPKHLQCNMLKYGTVRFRYGTLLSFCVNFSFVTTEVGTGSNLIFLVFCNLKLIQSVVPYQYAFDVTNLFKVLCPTSMHLMSQCREMFKNVVLRTCSPSFSFIKRNTIFSKNSRRIDGSRSFILLRGSGSAFKKVRIRNSLQGLLDSGSPTSFAVQEEGGS